MADDNVVTTIFEGDYYQLQEDADDAKAQIDAFADACVKDAEERAGAEEEASRRTVEAHRQVEESYMRMAMHGMHSFT